MKVILGLFLIIAGSLTGLYVGVYLMFFGGIVQIIHELQAHSTFATIHAGPIAVGICRIVFASAVGGLSAFLAVMPGFAMLGFATKSAKFGRF